MYWVGSLLYFWIFVFRSLAHFFLIFLIVLFVDKTHHPTLNGIAWSIPLNGRYYLTLGWTVVGVMRPLQSSADYQTTSTSQMPRWSATPSGQDADAYFVCFYSFIYHFVCFIIPVLELFSFQVQCVSFRNSCFTFFRNQNTNKTNTQTNCPPIDSQLDFRCGGRANR